MSDIPKISSLTVSMLVIHRPFACLRVEAVPALLVKRLFACAGIVNSESHASGVNEAFRIAPFYVLSAFGRPLEVTEIPKIDRYH